MKDNKCKIIKNMLKFLVFVGLLIIFYVLFADKAINLYLRRKTSVASSLDTIENSKQPVITICPKPNFKPAYFDENNVTNNDKVTFWESDENWKNYGKNKSIYETYKQMSFNYKTDWHFGIRNVSR